MTATSQRRPVRVALRNDYEIVLQGFARMLGRYRDRVHVVEMLEQHRVDEPVDVALYDTFAQQEGQDEVIAQMVANPLDVRVAIYTWNLQQELIDAALAQGVRGYFAKSLSAPDLVDAIERVAAGEVVRSPAGARPRSNPGLEWPGRPEGITDRESEVLALITQGRSNAEIARLTYLSPNTIKTHIRVVYRKIGVTNRVQAALWGTRNGFEPDHDHRQR